MTLAVYGIKNCDTMKKAFAWLDGAGVAYVFHDYKKTPPDAAQLARWDQAVGLAALVNRRGTTWRRLDEATRAAIDAGDAALIRATLAAQPSLIRRPLVEAANGDVQLGFDADALAAFVAEHRA